MEGLGFHRVDDALGFHTRCIGLLMLLPFLKIIGIGDSGDFRRSGRRLDREIFYRDRYSAESAGCADTLYSNCGHAGPGNTLPAGVERRIEQRIYLIFTQPVHSVFDLHRLVDLYPHQSR